jgi:hypothetical protein
MDIGNKIEEKITQQGCGGSIHEKYPNQNIAANKEEISPDDLSLKKNYDACSCEEKEVNNREIKAGETVVSPTKIEMVSTLPPSTLTIQKNIVTNNLTEIIHQHLAPLIESLKIAKTDSNNQEGEIKPSINVVKNKNFDSIVQKDSNLEIGISEESAHSATILAAAMAAAAAVTSGQPQTTNDTSPKTGKLNQLSPQAAASTTALTNALSSVVPNSVQLSSNIQGNSPITNGSLYHSNSAAITATALLLQQQQQHQQQQKTLKPNSNSPFPVSQQKLPLNLQSKTQVQTSIGCITQSSNSTSVNPTSCTMQQALNSIYSPPFNSTSTSSTTTVATAHQLLKAATDLLSSINNAENSNINRVLEEQTTTQDVRIKI